MEFITDAYNYWQPSLKAFASNSLQGLLIFFVGWWVINILCKLMLVFVQKATSDIGVTSFLSSFMKFFLRIILAVSVLGFMGFNVTSLFAAIGASLVAIGISLKDSISNLVSGIILVITKPIHVGDYIELENVKGTVIKIEMIFTTLQSPEEGKTVIVPNARLVSNNVTRKSEYNLVSVKKDFEIEFTEKYTEFKKYIQKELILNRKILQLPLPEIGVAANEKNTVSIKLEVWCQAQYSEKIAADLEKTIQKLLAKYKNKKL